MHKIWPPSMTSGIVLVLQDSHSYYVHDWRSQMKVETQPKGSLLKYKSLCKSPFLISSPPSSEDLYQILKMGMTLPSWASNSWIWARSSFQRHRGGSNGDSYPHNADIQLARSSRLKQGTFTSTTRLVSAGSSTSMESEFLDTPQIEMKTHTESDKENPFSDPQDNESQHNDLPPSKPQSHTWIKGVFLCAFGTGGLLLVNIIIVSVAAGLSSKYPGNGGTPNSKVIYDGSCDTTNNWDNALHAIINIISTLTLAASNYSMQALVAPTRSEIDRYHAAGRWVHIGGSSLRNLFAIPRPRICLWLVLFITATPFHLLYDIEGYFYLTF